MEWLPDARAIADQLEKKGVKLALGASVYDPTDPMGKMFFNILATFAEFEADLIACVSAKVDHGTGVGHLEDGYGYLAGLTDPSMDVSYRDITWWTEGFLPSTSTKGNLRS